MNNIKLIWIIVAIFESLMILAGADTDGSAPIKYMSYVDDHGFYQVLDITTHKPSPYENRILTINQGDIVTWINIPLEIGGYSVPLTVISEEDLWHKGNGNLGAFRQNFSYEFDQPGKYTLYIQEYPARRQTIIVNAIDHPVPTLTESQVIPTPTTIPTSVPIPTKMVHLPDNPSRTETYIPIKTPNVGEPNPKSPANFLDNPDIKIPIELSQTMIASIIVVILSIFLIFGWKR